MKLAVSFVCSILLLRGACLTQYRQENRVAAAEVRICSEARTIAGLKQLLQAADSRYREKELFQVFILSSRKEYWWLHNWVYGFDIWKIWFRSMARTRWSLGVVTGGTRIGGSQMRIRHGEEIVGGEATVWEHSPFRMRGDNERGGASGYLRLLDLHIDELRWANDRPPVIIPFFANDQALDVSEAQRISERLNREWYPFAYVYFGENSTCFAGTDGSGQPYYWFRADLEPPACGWAVECASRTLTSFRCREYRPSWERPLH